MTAEAPFKESVRTIMRDRLLDAAYDLAISQGWSSVTMAALASQVGVSRQTVYNEFGNKPQVAEALILRELERFLSIVRERILSADDIVAAVWGAAEGALSFADESPLVSQALSSVDDNTELLPYLTTDSQQIIETAKLVIIDAMGESQFGIPFDDAADIDRAVEMVVRLVLSALTRPSKTPAETADDIAWMLTLVLRGYEGS